MRRFSGAHDGDQGHRRVGGARGIRAQFGPQVPDNHFDDSIRSVPDFHVDGLPGCRPRAEWYPRCGTARLRSARSLLPQARGGAHPLTQKATGARSDDCWYPSRCLGPLAAHNQQQFRWQLLSRQDNAVLHQQYDDVAASTIRQCDHDVQQCQHAARSLSLTDGHGEKNPV